MSTGSMTPPAVGHYPAEVADLEYGEDLCPELPQTRQANPIFSPQESGGDNPHGRPLNPGSVPDFGQEFLGFDILSKIGEGAFAKVYLARQGSLSNRLVVLKISPEAVGEAHVLAQLLHTNVVPIYSVHECSGHSVVCMPFLGTTTLADVVKEVRQRGLPASGRSLVNTLQEHRSTWRSSSRRSSARHSSGRISSLPSEPSPISFPGPISGEVCPPLPANVLDQAPGTRALLEKLEGLSYVEAILWLTQRLADGLAHAHERGILHRDLKPANVLLTDEGQPMLLDFNLAEDTKERGTADGARQGGTLPYMSPEQLEAFQGAKQRLDPRSDLYSLGVILFELLTGHYPFPSYSGPTRDILDKMIADRRQAPPRLRPWNKSISPAVEAIVRHCLEPDPAQRYQTARDLVDDVRRQREHLPLRHVPEPSWGERFGKWAHRHPRLTSFTTVFLLATLLTGGLLGLLKIREQKLGEYEALASLRTFARELTNVHFDLAQAGADRQRLQDPVAKGRQALQRYQILNQPNWLELSLAANLDAEHRAELQGGVRTMLLLLARAEAFEAADLPSGQERTAVLNRALLLSDKAKECRITDVAPRAWWLQRGELLALLGNQEGADFCHAQAVQAPQDNPQDKLLTGREHLVQGRLREALPLLKDAAREDPQNVPAWFLLGRCHDGLGQTKEAAACYTTCIALRPKEPQPYFQRGISYLQQRDYRLARADFDQTIALAPKNYDAFFNRALAHHGLQNHKEALADVDQAMALNAPYTRIYFLRARLQDSLGDGVAAKKDAATGLEREPGDEQSWNTRGYARLASDPKGALKDFQAALEINPRSHTALGNIAHVLADVQKDPEQALTILNKAVGFYPDDVGLRTGRALLLARSAQRDAAVKDAKEVLARNAEPATLYRVAGIYAQTSAKQPADAQESLRHLTAALRQGYGLNLLDRDPDFTPLHERKEFQKLVEVAKVLR